MANVHIKVDGLLEAASIVETEFVGSLMHCCQVELPLSALFHAVHMMTSGRFNLPDNVTCRNLKSIFLQILSLLAILIEKGLVRS